MNRIALSLIFLLALMSAAYAGSETTNQLPPAATLTGEEPVPLWQSGTTVQTTARAIAALGASTSGAGIPGGLSTQPQYNNGGNFGGLNEYDVTAYGAKCDGVIIAAGVQTTNGSPLVTSGNVGGTGQWYVFSSKDIGATITITQQSPLNGLSINSTYTSTIQSVSGGVATLAGNVPFTTSSGYGSGSPGGSARFYHTDDTTAIQNTLTAGASQANAPFYSGARIKFPSGVCVAKGLVFYSNEVISGEGRDTSYVMLPANANTDLFVSYQYNYYNTTPNTAAGNAGNRFENIHLDGNRGSNTGSGSGTTTGAGDGIRAWWSAWSIDNVAIDFFAADGLLSANNFPAGNPFVINPLIPAGATTVPDGAEFHLRDVYFTYNAGWGFVDDGPHDSEMAFVWTIGNGLGGILIPTVTPYYNAGQTNIFNFHGYAENVNIDLENYGSVNCTLCTVENLFIDNDGAGYDTFYSSNINLQIGKPSGGSSVPHLQVVDTYVASLNNSYGDAAGNGASHNWTNSSIGSLSGTYRPSQFINASGFTGGNNNVSLNMASGPFALNYCLVGSPYTCQNPFTFNVNSSDLMTISGGSSPTGFMSLDGSANVAFGPGSAGNLSGVGADFHNYGTSSNSSMSLPQSITANRPACSGSTAGAIRFNSSTNLFEGCNGNGSTGWQVLASGPVLSTAVPNVFSAGQSVSPITIPIATSTFTPNFVSGNSFIITMNHSACPCTLANPANFVPGQSGIIYVVQSGSGSDTFGTYGSNYIFSGGTAPTLSTGAGAIDVLSYSSVVIGATNYVLINASLNFHN